jgi:hypothetical protein
MLIHPTRRTADPQGTLPSCKRPGGSLTVHNSSILIQLAIYILTDAPHEPGVERLTNKTGIQVPRNILHKEIRGRGLLALPEIFKGLNK